MFIPHKNICCDFWFKPSRQSFHMGVEYGLICVCLWKNMKSCLLYDDNPYSWSYGCDLIYGENSFKAVFRSSGSKSSHWVNCYKLGFPVVFFLSVIEIVSFRARISFFSFTFLDICKPIMFKPVAIRKLKILLVTCHFLRHMQTACV